ncbi:MAG: carboxymuconolactone decarboxylase family protein [Verrucomicrobia bacterium]|nr:carboxymuconolactone decarboxylase family protein [Verrucomicrobiota bacterium]
MSQIHKTKLALQTLETAAPRAKAVLEQAKAKLGFIPNMYGGMVNSPGLLETYMLGYDRFRAESTFTAVEQEVVFLTISRENGCTYCVAAHSVIADAFSKVPPAVTDAIRERKTIPDAKLEALSAFTRIMWSSRGKPTPEEAAAFFAAGYDERQILEIILATAVKTLSNYPNHLFATPVDAIFRARKWTPPAA